VSRYTHTHRHAYLKPWGRRPSKVSSTFNALLFPALLCMLCWGLCFAGLKAGDNSQKRPAINRPPAFFFNSLSSPAFFAGLSSHYVRQARQANPQLKVHGCSPNVHFQYAQMELTADTSSLKIRLLSHNSLT
jgi:hypothetical protein